MSNAQYGPPRHQGWNQPPPPPVQPPYQPAPQPVPLPPFGPGPYTVPASYPQTQPYVIPPRPFNHGAHLIADLCTFGMWFPFHLLIWALHPRRPVLVTPDGKRQKL